MQRERQTQHPHNNGQSMRMMYVVVSVIMTNMLLKTNIFLLLLHRSAAEVFL